MHYDFVFNQHMLRITELYCSYAQYIPLTVPSLCSSKTGELVFTVKSQAVVSSLLLILPSSKQATEEEC